MDLGLNKVPWYGQIILFVVIAGAGIYAFDYFYADGVRVELAKKQRELDEVRARVTRGNAIAAQLPKFQAELIRLEQHLAGLKQVLPEQRDVGDMLRRIQTLAAASSLNVRQFKPQPVTNKELHAEWPMQLEFDGNYHDLGLFFDKVAKVPRIINISGINIRAKDARQSVETSTTVTAQVTATTFVLLDKPAEEAGKGKDKGKPGAAGATGAPKLSAQNTATAR
jgi:type IV pilus assembly protein PilO